MLTVPEKHQLAIAKASMKQSCVGVMVLGGPNHRECVKIIEKFTGRIVKVDSDCTCKGEKS